MLNVDNFFEKENPNVTATFSQSLNVSVADWKVVLHWNF